MRRLIICCSTIAVLTSSTVPAQAAPTASITGAYANASWTQGRATMTFTYDQCGPGACAWNAIAIPIPATQYCPDNILDIAGEPQGQQYSSPDQSANGSINAGEVQFQMPGIGPMRLCSWYIDRTPGHAQRHAYNTGILFALEPVAAAPGPAVVMPPPVAAPVAAAPVVTKKKCKKPKRLKHGKCVRRKKRKRHRK